MAHRIIKTNKIVSHACYPTIVAEYNEIQKRDGKVNNAKFFMENVAPRIGIDRATWYRHIKSFTLAAELLAPKLPIATVPRSELVAQENGLVRTLADSAQATQIGIQTALNIGSKALQELIDNPESMSREKRINILFKAMRAQDSRIFATAAVKKDRREEKAFQKTFNDAAYQEDLDEYVPQDQSAA